MNRVLQIGVALVFVFTTTGDLGAQPAPKNEASTKAK